MIHVAHVGSTLTTKSDNNDKYSTRMRVRRMVADNKKMISGVHRALIFQGGGSLGAYEAGAYKDINEERTSGSLLLPY